MFFLMLDLVVNVIAFAVLARGHADPLMAWAIVVLIAALNVVGVFAFVEADQARWANRKW